MEEKGDINGTEERLEGEGQHSRDNGDMEEKDI